MKTLNILMILLTACFLQACKRDHSKQFLQGTFINASAGEFSLADDSLIIQPTGENNFTIHRRTGYNLVRHGRQGKRTYESERWQAVYDEATKTLKETRKGKLISIHPDSGYILIGKREYKKIK